MVVRQSVHPDWSPRDRVVEIDGVNALDWFEKTMRLYSNSSEGYRFAHSFDDLMELYDSRQLIVDDHQGNLRSVSAGPFSYPDTADRPWRQHMSEWLLG